MTKTYPSNALRTLATPRLFLRLIHGTSDLCYSPLSTIARTEVDANDAMDMRVGMVRAFPGPCGGSTGLKPSPIAHVILKSRAPRRLRLTT